VPNLFIEQIDFILKNANKHVEEFRGLKDVLESISERLPEVYRSKSGRIVDNRSDNYLYCKIPYLDGLIENINKYLAT
jgi:hypothetical protein